MSVSGENLRAQTRFELPAARYRGKLAVDRLTLEPVEEAILLVDCDVDWTLELSDYGEDFEIEPPPAAGEA